MVRAVKLQGGNSGSYYNLSQGAFGAVELVSTGIQGVEQGILISVFPNPTNGNLRISGAPLNTKFIRIHDITGKLILDLPFTKVIDLQ